MKLLRLLSALTLVGVVAAVSAALQYEPPAAKAPDAATLRAIEKRTDELAQALDNLRRHSVHDPYLADVEIFYKAARWIVRHGEFYRKEYPQWTLEVLDRGLLRASQAGRGESPWLQQAGRPVVRAYRSHVDGSVQPYAVTYPADYGKDPKKRWRFDVVLHGRDTSLTEVSFLHRHDPGNLPATDHDFVQVDIYGRGNNAYRWAGETDVIEAVENFITVERALGRGTLLDPGRTVLRGFSMGGAGTWHLGLHRPDEWSVIGPGAGFTTTHGYVKGLPDKLPPYQEACLRIYDAVDYAANAADVPVVAYAGADDPQLQAARNIEAKLKERNIPMALLVAPGLGHQFPPQWQKKAEAEYARHLVKERSEHPRHVHFVTYTLRYPKCYWVEILALGRHYEKALVDAERSGDDALKVQTENVRALHLGLWEGATRETVTVDIDGQQVKARPYQALVNPRQLHLYLERRDGRWTDVLPEWLMTERLRVRQKVEGLQGPIDDAFAGPFLCVRGTRPPWHDATERYAEGDLQRFQNEWSKYLRGELPVKDDVDVTPHDIATSHLILFGDPASNTLIEQVLPGLPLKWTKEQITWGGKGYAAKEQVPVLIYPSPLAANRYVVLNSGHTFHAADFRGTNALLYPRLGDHALLRLAGNKKDPLGVEVITAGIFDDHWRMAAE
jgi:predicted esterase